MTSWPLAGYAGELQAARTKRIAFLHRARVEATLEPAHTLLGRAMRERFGRRPALRQTIIADRACGVETLFDVARFEKRA